MMTSIYVFIIIKIINRIAAAVSKYAEQPHYSVQRPYLQFHLQLSIYHSSCKSKHSCGGSVVLAAGIS